MPMLRRRADAPYIQPDAMIQARNSSAHTAARGEPVTNELCRKVQLHAARELEKGSIPGTRNFRDVSSCAVLPVLIILLSYELRTLATLQTIQLVKPRPACYSYRVSGSGPGPRKKSYGAAPFVEPHEKEEASIRGGLLRQERLLIQERLRQERLRQEEELRQEGLRQEEAKRVRLPPIITPPDVLDDEFDGDFDDDDTFLDDAKLEAEPNKRNKRRTAKKNAVKGRTAKRRAVEASEHAAEDVETIWLAVVDSWSRSLDELKALRSDLELLKTTIDP